MIKNVVKRDGRLVAPDSSKIQDAILKAFIEIDGEKTEEAVDISYNISLDIFNIDDETLTVEQIQDIVEKKLMNSNRPDVAKVFILYRNERTKEREANSELVQRVWEKINADNVENANANVDEQSFGGRKQEASSIVQKSIALQKIISPKVAQAHEDGYLYEHDLDSTAVGMHNCLSRETEFITDKGVKSFLDFKDGDFIKVLTHQGIYKNAKVRNFGKQQLFNYHFKRYNNFKTVKATRNHRWLLNDGTWSNFLNIDDKLMLPKFFFDEFTFDNLTDSEKRYWCWGFVRGDGTNRHCYSKKDSCYYKSDKSKVKLCGEKILFKERFEECGYHSNTEEILVPDYNRTLPNSDNATINEMIAFIHGLYDADGSQTSVIPNSNTKRYSIQFGDKELCDFVEHFFECAGLYISSVLDKTGQETNYSVRGYTKQFSFFSKSEKFKYKLVDITKANVEEVWCLEVEDDHSFVLTNGLVTGNCLQLDFQRLFTHGFSTRNGDVRPPSSFSTACQLVAVAFQCQSQVQFGGVGSIHLDIDLAPFVKMSFAKHLKDGIKWIEGIESRKRGQEILKNFPKSISVTEVFYKNRWPKAWQYAYELTEREGLQAAQGLYHNLNTLESRQGSQVPFTSINFGRDTNPEGRLVSKWMLQASIDGIGKFHRTSIFPISIFQYKHGCNATPDDLNYDLFQLALKSLSKRIYPNFANCNWSQAHEDETDPDTYFSTMGCRTLIGYDRHGLGYKKVGRGNNLPITIILPKLGIEFGTCLGERETPDLDGFKEKFEEVLSLTEHGLLERFNYMCKQSPSSAPFMYENGTIKDSDKCKSGVYESLRHNTLAIGYIGVAEMCQALFGVNHAHSETAHKFALGIIKRINEFAKEASERNNLNFSCYATPAENLCYTAMKNLNNQYGTIKNVTDRDYITNSHHVPVWEQISIYDKLRVEAPFCKYPTGGCITYVECESSFMQNLKAIEDIIHYAFDELDIPYLAINFPIDSCLDCGYQSEFNDVCPECKSENILQLRRVTGYLSTDKRNFNKGKISEEADRVKHSLYSAGDHDVIS